MYNYLKKPSWGVYFYISVNVEIKWESNFGKIYWTITIRKTTFSLIITCKPERSSSTQSLKFYSNYSTRPMIKENQLNYHFVKKSNVLYQQDGRGNNWAMGYHCTQSIQKRKKNSEQPVFQSNKLLLENTLEMVRK